jgi:hypothetical protein
MAWRCRDDDITPEPAIKEAEEVEKGLLYDQETIPAPFVAVASKSALRIARKDVACDDQNMR